MKKQFFLNYLKSFNLSTQNKKKAYQYIKQANIKKLNNTIKLKKKNYNFFCRLQKFISYYLCLISQDKFNPNIIY